MTMSISARLSLILFLPALALFLFVEGQRYDPARIRFEPSQSEGSGLIALVPSDISGYTRKGPVRSYTKENLYEYVNGHAEYFISAGFVTLAVGEYGKSGSPDAAPDVTVDIYDTGRSIQSFGVLSDE